MKQKNMVVCLNCHLLSAKLTLQAKYCAWFVTGVFESLKGMVERPFKRFFFIMGRKLTG